MNELGEVGKYTMVICPNALAVVTGKSLGLGSKCQNL